MATIAGEPGRSARTAALWLGAALAMGGAAFFAIGSCAPAAPPAGPQPEPRPEPPAARPPEREIRVGLAVGASFASLGGREPLSVTDPAGVHLVEIAAGETWRVSAAGSGLIVSSPAGGSSVPSEALSVIPRTPADPVRVNGRGYRGVVEILQDRTGLTLVNRLGLEAYLQGVVSAEMGRRAPTEQEALRAQAVVSRTYALRNLQRWAVQGFDLYASVADQVYGGTGKETPEGIAAVESTRGLVLTYGGAPIDAFFYSTCGGRTAEGTEVFRFAERPYLRSVLDVAENGIAYCSISPRYRWREEWTGEALGATLRRTLPAATGIRADQVREVSDVRVTSRTGSGRVGQLAVALSGPELRVNGPAVRQVLRPPSGEVLRSAAFSLIATGAGRRVTRLVAEGSGAGHGVGFCQWGAVGRSRAGQDYQQILSAYYPGATLERLY